MSDSRGWQRFLAALPWIGGVVGFIVIALIAHCMKKWFCPMICSRRGVTAAPVAARLERSNTMNSSTGTLRRTNSIVPMFAPRPAERRATNPTLPSPRAHTPGGLTRMNSSLKLSKSNSRVNLMNKSVDNVDLEAGTRVARSHSIAGTRPRIPTHPPPPLPTLAARGSAMRLVRAPSLIGNILTVAVNSEDTGRVELNIDFSTMDMEVQQDTSSGETVDIFGANVSDQTLGSTQGSSTGTLCESDEELEIM